MANNRTTKTSLPAVASSVSPDVRMYLERVREELSRIQDAQNQTTTIINNYGLGGGGGGGFNPNDPDNQPCGKTVSPTTPTGLKVAAGFSFYMIEWDMPSYCGHSRTEVYGRKGSDALGGEVFLGASQGSMFVVAEPNMGTRYCFWIKHVNLRNEKSAFNALGGVCGTTALDPGYLIDLLTGQITESHLYKSLGDRINLIDLPGVGLIDQVRDTQTADGAIAQRISETSAQSATKVWVFIQATTPTAKNAGDLWYDITAPNLIDLKIWSTTDDAWNGKRLDLVPFRQVDVPQNLSPGGLGYTTRVFAGWDIWFDTNDSNTPYYWNGVGWTSLANGYLGSLAEAKIVNYDSARIGYCTLEQTDPQGEKYYITTDDDSSAKCAAAGGVWKPGLPWAKAVTQVSVTYNNQAVTLEQQFEAIYGTNGLLAQYTIKIDNAGHISGFGLSSETLAGGGVTSDFGVRSDRFWLAPPTIASATPPDPVQYPPYRGQVWLDTSKTPKVTNYYAKGISGVTDGWYPNNAYAAIPFTVQTSPAIISGQEIPPGVYMNAAYIRDATITNAKIRNATIDDAKILNLSANKIKAGAIAVTECITSESEYNSVTHEKQWSICGNGEAVFNKVTVRGTVLGGGASNYGTATGMFSGWTGTGSTNYKFRVGDPTGARLDWDGSALRVYNSLGYTVLKSGAGGDSFFLVEEPNGTAPITRVKAGYMGLVAGAGKYGLLLRDRNGKVALASHGTRGFTNETDAWGEPFPGDDEFYISSAYIKKLRAGNIDNRTITDVTQASGSWGPSSLGTGAVQVAIAYYTVADLPAGETAEAIVTGSVTVYPSSGSPYGGTFICGLRADGANIGGASSAVYTQNTAQCMAFTGKATVGNGSHHFQLVAQTQSGTFGTVQFQGQVTVMLGKR